MQAICTPSQMLMALTSIFAFRESVPGYPCANRFVYIDKKHPVFFFFFFFSFSLFFSFFFFFFLFLFSLSWIVFQSSARFLSLSLSVCLSLSLSLSPSTPSPHPISSPFSVTLLFHFSFTSHNIYYITPITRHCHANNLPSTEQAVKTQPKEDKYFFLFSSFLTIYLLFKCRFVAW